MPKISRVCAGARGDTVKNLGSSATPLAMSMIEWVPESGCDRSSVSGSTGVARRWASRHSSSRNWLTPLTLTGGVELSDELVLGHGVGEDGLLFVVIARLVRGLPQVAQRRRHVLAERHHVAQPDAPMSIPLERCWPGRHPGQERRSRG